MFQRTNLFRRAVPRGYFYRGWIYVAMAAPAVAVLFIFLPKTVISILLQVAIAGMGIIYWESLTRSYRDNFIRETEEINPRLRSELLAPRPWSQRFRGAIQDVLESLRSGEEFFNLLQLGQKNEEITNLMKSVVWDHLKEQGISEDEMTKDPAAIQEWQFASAYRHIVEEIFRRIITKKNGFLRSIKNLALPSISQSDIEKYANVLTETIPGLSGRTQVGPRAEVRKSRGGINDYVSVLGGRIDKAQRTSQQIRLPQSIRIQSSLPSTSPFSGGKKATAATNINMTATPSTSLTPRGVVVDSQTYTNEPAKSSSENLNSEDAMAFLRDVSSMGPNVTKRVLPVKTKDHIYIALNKKLKRAERAEVRALGEPEEREAEGGRKEAFPSAFKLPASSSAASAAVRRAEVRRGERQREDGVVLARRLAGRAEVRSTGHTAKVESRATLQFEMHIRPMTAILDYLSPILSFKDWKITYRPVEEGQPVGEEFPFDSFGLLPNAPRLIEGGEMAIYVESSQKDQGILVQIASSIAKIVSLYKEKRFEPGFAAEDALEAMALELSHLLDELKKKGIDIPVTRAEVRDKGESQRSELRKVEAELMKDRNFFLRTPRQTIIETAIEWLEDFRGEDAKILRENIQILQELKLEFPQIEQFILPSAVAAPPIEKDAVQITTQISSALSTKLASEMAIIASPKTFQLAGPLLAAVQDKNRSGLRVAVVADGSSEERIVYRQVVEQLNLGLKLPADARLRVYDNFHAANFALTRQNPSQIMAIVSNKAEADLLRRLLPDITIRNRSWLDSFSNDSSLLAEQLAEFSAAFQRALETAA